MNHKKDMSCRPLEENRSFVLGFMDGCAGKGNDILFQAVRFCVNKSSSKKY
jgi:hypothetical protein